jgi:hypothetical protein
LLSELKKNSELELIIKIKKNTAKNFTLIFLKDDELMNKINKKIDAANKLPNDNENPHKLVPSVISPTI